MSEEKAEKKTQSTESEAVIERGFNDDELADIMSEIEDLEKEFSEDSIAKEVQKDVQEAQEKEGPDEKVELKEVQAEPKMEEELSQAAEEIAEPVHVEEKTVAVNKPVIEDHSASNEDLTQELNNFKVPKKEHSDKPRSKSSDVSELHHIKEERSSLSSASNLGATRGDNRMTFSLQGQMTLNMEFICGSKVIELVVDKESFSVKLDNGMSFYLPFDELSGKKAG